MKSVVSVGVLLLGVSAISASAVEPPVTASPTAAAGTTAATVTPAAAPVLASAPLKRRQICRSEQAAGTRFTQKVCRDATDQDAIRKGSKEFVEAGQRRLQDVKAGGE